METLATTVTLFFLKKRYIEPDQAEWFQYGLVRRMMGCLTFLLLLPLGAILAGWGGSLFYIYTFRFLRMRTGGYHAKTPCGCLLTTLCTMYAALILAQFLHSRIHTGTVLIVATMCILILAPANNASLHLTVNEIDAIRQRARIRLAGVVLIDCLLLYCCMPLGNCMAVSLLAVAVMLILANFGFGVQ